MDILTHESPLHAWYASPKLNPEFREEVKEEFDVGQAAHALLFEGVNKMAIFDPADYPNQKGGGFATGWTNKAIREARDAARADGKIPVLKETSIALQAMVAAARQAWEENSDLAGYRLDGGRNEWSIVWFERYPQRNSNASAPVDYRVAPTESAFSLSDVWFRCKPDHLSADRRLIVDAKFTETSANPAAFERQIDRMGYDSRAGFYLRGNAATGGPEEARYVYLVQEQKPPYAAAFISLDPAYLDLGRRKVQRAITTWRSCMTSGEWPGYLPRIHYAAPPAYAIAQQEEQEVRGFEYDPAVLFGGAK